MSAVARRRTIPEIRERLLEIAAEHGIPEVADLAHETRREFHGRKAPVESAAVTPELAERVRRYATENPRASMLKIGVKFGLNQGRVSEIMFGKRGEG